MEDLAVHDLCCKLKEEGIDQESIEQIKSESSTSQLASCNNVLCHSANEIDGETLLLLVNDHQEFAGIITKTLSRLKIKKIVNNMMQVHAYW